MPPSPRVILQPGIILMLPHGPDFYRDTIYKQGLMNKQKPNPNLK
jgi:hypothetical protein